MKETEQRARYFTFTQWASISPALKRKWWAATNYGEREPSPDLVAEIKEAIK